MYTDTNKSILIVDNDPGVIAALSARLGGMGYRCTTAGCSDQALSQFSSCNIDLVISDLNMPQGDGAVLAQAIRRTSGVPIIIISGFKDAYRKKLNNIANVSFLHKPFETKELLQLVSASLATPGSQAGTTVCAT
jgi:DNA-binding response OmpR family regulator